MVLQNPEQKRQYLLKTIQMFIDEFKPDNKDKNLESIISGFEAIMDTIGHTAPEIITSRWKDIFNFCKAYLNDQTNEAHNNCLKIYTWRIKEYYN